MAYRLRSLRAWLGRRTMTQLAVGIAVMAAVALTGSLMAYALPRADDMPPVEIEKIVTRSPSNALGAKGVGEAGCIGVPAAIFNAVCDAVAPFGPHELQMPLTSEKVWRAIAGRPTNARGGNDR